MKHDNCTTMTNDTATWVLREDWERMKEQRDTLWGELETVKRERDEAAQAERNRWQNVHADFVRALKSHKSVLVRNAELEAAVLVKDAGLRKIIEYCGSEALRETMLLWIKDQAVEVLSAPASPLREAIQCVTADCAAIGLNVSNEAREALWRALEPLRPFLPPPSRENDTPA